MTSGDIAIAGIGETPCLRRSDRTIRQMALDAINLAIADAGISPRDIDCIVTEGALMPRLVPHEFIGAQLGLDRHIDASISQVGAGIVASTMLAEMAIKSGRAKVVLSYFATDWGSDPRGPYSYHDGFPSKRILEKPYGFSAQPSFWGLWTQRYMHEFGLTEEQMGAVAVQQRANAILTGRAQMHKPMTIDDYLDAPMISDPLRIPDCCLISDGAAAFIMVGGDRARDCPSKPVYVRGVSFSSVGSPDELFTQGNDLLVTPGARSAALQVEQQVGIRLGEADFGQLYDCFTPACLLQIEDLGLCEKGEAGHFVAEGHTSLTGRLPINTHGGLLSYSYRLGVEHITEAVRQLRGEAGAVQVKDAEVGFVTGESFPDFSVLVLGV